MVENGVDFESMESLDTQVKDLNSRKKSLRREIDENYVMASRLRDQIKALSETYEEKKVLVSKVNVELINKNSEISDLDSKINSERRILEIERRELDSIKKDLESRQSLFEEEKRGQLAIFAQREEKVAKDEIENDKKKKELDEREKQAIGELAELSSRRLKVNESESRLGQKESEIEKLRKEAEIFINQSKNEADELKSQKLFYQDESKKAKLLQDEAAKTQENLTLALELNDVKKRELDERERDVLLVENKVRDIKSRLVRDIELAKLPKEQKDKLSNELK